MRRRSGNAVTFTLWWYRIAITVIVALYGFGISAAVADYSTPLAVALAVPSTALAFRACRCATVRLSPDGVVVRGLVRTQRATWDDVTSINVGWGPSMGMPWRVPFFAL